MAPTPKTLKRCLAEVNRATSVTIPVECWEFELPVLGELHGEQSVSAMKSWDAAIPDNFTSVDAYALLERKYGSDAGRAAVRYVYRNVQALAKATGLPYSRGDENAVRYQEAQVIVRTVEDMLAKEAA